jgi:hypothetical protein
MSIQVIDDTKNHNRDMTGAQLQSIQSVNKEYAGNHEVVKIIILKITSLSNATRTGMRSHGMRIENI